MFHMINAESLLSDVRSGKINFADLSKEQLRYFLSTVALDCTDEVHEYHVMRKVLLNLPRDEQLRICDEYFWMVKDFPWLFISDLWLEIIEGEGGMGAGVEILKESVIRVQSQLNDWMDCVFVVNKNDE